MENFPLSVTPDVADQEELELTSNHGCELEDSDSTEMNSVADDMFSDASSVASIKDLTELCSSNSSGGYLDNMLWKEEEQTRHCSCLRPRGHRRNSSVNLPFVGPTSPTQLQLMRPKSAPSYSRTVARPKSAPSRHRYRRSLLSATEHAYDAHETIREEVTESLVTQDEVKEEEEMVTCQEEDQKIIGELCVEHYSLPSDQEYTNALVMVVGWCTPKIEEGVIVI